MNKKIVIGCCGNCFYIRNELRETCYCVKAVLLKRKEYSFNQEDLHKIPTWCPLLDDCSWLRRIFRRIK